MEQMPDDFRERLIPLFQQNFEKFGELGAAVSVWQNGKPIIDLHGGFCDARREKPWGQMRPLSSSGLPRRGSAAPAFCTRCKNITSTLTSGSQSSGPSLLSLAKKESRCRSCFHIKLGFALWVAELTCSITAQSFKRSKRKSYCVRLELLMVITPAPSAFFSTSLCVASLEKLYRIIGRKLLPSRSISIFGLACPERKIRG